MCVKFQFRTMAPADSDKVQAALRLGWLFAEVRGRAKPGGPTFAGTPAFARGNWVLPLGSERSAPEREVERQQALQVEASTLEVDEPVPGPLLQSLALDVPAAAAPVPAAAAGPVPEPTYSDVMRQVGTLLSSQKKDDDPDTNTTWLKFAKLLYKWDAHIQDTLLSASDAQANAYELGRGLAETYWALEPGAVQTITVDGVALPNPVSWSFLLGEERRAIMSRLLGRLVAYFRRFRVLRG